jgi:hypothetical protein
MTINTNWSLFYKFEGDRPKEFCEIRQYENKLWVASGKVCTWGEVNITEFDSIDIANRKYEEICHVTQVDDFILTKQGIYDSRNFDFVQLTNEISHAARQAFTAIRQAHPDRFINSFALFSDDSAMTISHIANSKEALPEVDYNEDCIWNCAEWSFDEGREFFDIAYRMILIKHREIPCEIEFESFRNGVFESCIQALELLDSDNFFGTGSDRNNTIILFQVTDLDDIRGAIERLNTENNVKLYKQWFDSWN